MPCLFFVDFPEEVIIHPRVAGALYFDVAKAVGLTIDMVEVHLGHEKYQILQSNGSKKPAEDVHVFVEWTERPYEVKKLVVAAIDKFLSFHGLQSDITFRDSPKGTFFVNGRLIGPEPESFV